MRARCFFPILLLTPFLLRGQELKEFQKKVTEFTLANGLHFIVAERHDAPVVSFHTYVAAGSADDPSGQTGLAHMFEHMAFKGTETIGSRNWLAEKKALEEVEQAYNRVEAERNKGPRADRKRIGSLQQQLENAIERAQGFVEPNEYTRIVEENGGADLNAETQVDSTEYYYSLPSNRLELWFLMESERFLHPVFREFYKERDVVMEENRMRIESSPQGKLVQDFLATAFAAHPYRNPPGGWPSDISNLRRAQAQRFFDEYYVPGNIVMAIVGDVNPAEAKRLAERYFSPLRSKPLPPLITTEEPPQPGPKTAVVYSPSQPVCVVGFKRPDQLDKDDATFDVIQLILSGGRTGVLYKQLIEGQRIALQADIESTFPAGRYPALFLFVLVPALGHTVEENERALDRLLTQFVSERVDAVTLARARTQARAGVIRRLANNDGLAALLTFYHANYGDWRKLFTSLDELDHVTADDVERVARQYFVASGRTTAATAEPPAAGVAHP